LVTFLHHLLPPLPLHDKMRLLRNTSQNVLKTGSDYAGQAA
jgi:hypothetical protein